MFDHLDRLFALLAGAHQQYFEAVRTGKNVEQALAYLNNVITQLLRSDAAKVAGKMWQDAVEQHLTDEAASPTAAADPARDVLASLDDISRVADELLALQSDPRFRVLHSPLGPPLALRFPSTEYVTRLKYVSDLLVEVSRDSQRAREALRKAHDPRRRMAPDYEVPTPPSQDRAYCIVPLPAEAYTSENQRTRHVRDLVLLFGHHLRNEAQLGRERLKKASLSDIAYRHTVVAAEASTLVLVVANGLLTCALLAQVACLPPGMTLPKKFWSLGEQDDHHSELPPGAA